MQPTFRDYFYFNRTQRKGVLILTFLIILIVVVKESLIYFNPEPPLFSNNLDSLVAIIDFKLDSIEQVEKAQQQSKIAESKFSIDSIDLNDFDPNGLPVERWQEFGLTEKQAEVIKRYESSGGNFRTKRDVKKMFVISDNLFEKIKPYILLPDSIVSQKKTFSKKDEWKYTAKKTKEKVKVLINSADTNAFKSLYGIGPVLSKRIVDYREKLGGFHSKEQLKKVYGLKEEVLQELDTLMVLDTITLTTININLVTIEQLKNHPLINWKVANSIVKYREQHGTYKNVGDIKKSVLVTDELFSQIQMYLSI